MKNMNLITRVLLIFPIMLLLILSLASCKAKHDSIEGQVSAASLEFGFEEIRRDILVPMCTNCHTGRHSAFENYNIVKVAANEILSRVKSQNQSFRMPKDLPPLSTDQIQKLERWVLAGAPEFAGIPPKPIATTTISFEEVHSKILKSNCIGCHSQFNNYQVVKKNISSIVSFVLDDKMPFALRPNQRNQPLSDELKETLSTWAEAGAPEFPGILTDSVDEVATSPKLEPTWISLRDNVIGPKCILCHNSTGPRAPTAMSTHSELRSWFAENPKLFDFKNPERSHFVAAILGRVDEDNEEYFYDPMPFNSDQDDIQEVIPEVTEAELNVILDWIRLGLPYDSQDIPASYGR